MKMLTNVGCYYTPFHNDRGTVRIDPCHLSVCLSVKYTLLTCKWKVFLKTKMAEIFAVGKVTDDEKGQKVESESYRVT